MTASPLRLHWFDPRNPSEDFPPSAQALRNPDGLIAAGGDLSVTRLLRAYSRGIFPWFNPNEPILWWTPDPRAVIVPSDLHASRSLRRAINRNDYRLSFDSAFAEVMRCCSERPGHGTWLGPSMQVAYLEMYRRGYAHSIELWHDDVLVGGLYGVALGRVFFGESMFSRANNASKIVMYWLCQQLRAWEFTLLDCQVTSAHLQRMGACSISRADFEKILKQAIPTCVAPAGKWHFDIDAPLRTS